MSISRGFLFAACAVSLLVSPCGFAQYTGSITVQATYNDVPWSGPVTFKLESYSAPQNGSSVPTVYGSQPAFGNAYTLVYVSGGPGTAPLTVLPSPTQVLTPGASVTFTIVFPGPLPNLALHYYPPAPAQQIAIHRDRSSSYAGLVFAPNATTWAGSSIRNNGGSLTSSGFDPEMYLDGSRAASTHGNAGFVPGARTGSASRSRD